MKGQADDPLIENSTILTEKFQLKLLLLKHGADTNIIYPESSHDDKRNGLKIINLQKGTTSSKTKGKKRTSNTSN